MWMENENFIIGIFGMIAKSTQRDLCEKSWAQSGKCISGNLYRVWVYCLHFKAVIFDKVSVRLKNIYVC